MRWTERLTEAKMHRQEQLACVWVPLTLERRARATVVPEAARRWQERRKGFAVAVTATKEQAQYT